MNNAVAEFNRRFSNWEIRLPPDAVKSRRRGKILKAGWVIWYVFGSDETSEFLDYYSSHRMTDDEHVRLYADGRKELLPAIFTFRRSSPDPDEDARLESEYYARNRAVSSMLEEKGFGLSGDEPGLTQVNRYLHTVGPRKKSKK